MIGVEMKWKNGLSAWVEGLERLFRIKGGRLLGGGAEKPLARKEAETEGEKALWSAMGWEGE